MSPEDRSRAVAEGSPEDRTFVVANGVDIERFVPHHEPSDAPELFYVGSFRHLPNILGFEKLWHEVMPLVWQRCPEARLRVVAGPDHQRYWREFLRRAYPASFDPRIVVHGFVEDLRPLYARATLVLAPLLVSAGTNIKVMEAMACRKAVVSTPIGCAGLGLVDGHDALVREGSPAFAVAVCELLDDAGRREEIAAHARRTVEERFSWRAIAEQAYASYRKLSGVPAR
jgi:glycosyltransferase involved in cell wall biosynthesis